MIAALMVIAIIGPSVSWAGAVKRSLVFMPRFTRVGGLAGVGGLSTNGRYVVVETGLGQSVVIDDQTGLRRQLPTGCDVTGLGSVWLATGCQTSPDQASLVDQRTGQSTPFAISPELLNGCQTSANPTPCPWVSAVGRYWVAVTGHSGNYHVDYVTSYQNRMTGKVVSAPTDPRLNVDLNASGLIVRVCSPLAVPRGEEGLTYPGSLLALGHGLQIASREQVDLERCGTHQRIHLYAASDGYSSPTSGCATFIYCPPATNAHSIVWELTDSHTGGLRSIAGILLPSLQRFTITPPRTSPTHDPVSVALTNTHLYLRVDDKLYRAPAPTHIAR